jgi:uncharacterized protein (DUF58 family)
VKAGRAAVLARWRLARPTRARRGAAGERPGDAAGGALEFRDVRDYAAGDDVRRIDWSGFARSDVLRIRLHEEELSPAVDILADLSASMGSTPGKAAALADLVEGFALLAGQGGGRPRRLACGGARFADADDAPLDPPAPSTAPRAAAAGAVGAGGAAVAPGLLLPREALRPRGVRIVVSDFLQPADPAPFLRRASAGASLLVVVQLLDPWELSPALEGATALRDLEDGARLEVDDSAALLERYTARLSRLCEAVRCASRACGALHARVTAAPLGAMCADALFPAGIVEPAR